MLHTMTIRKGQGLIVRRNTDVDSKFESYPREVKVRHILKRRLIGCPNNSQTTSARVYTLALQEKDEEVSLFNDRAVAGALTMTSVKVG